MLGYSLVNTLVLILLTILLHNQPYLYKDEELVISLNKIVKTIILGWESKPPSENYLFINTAYDNQLTDKYDDSGVIPLGNEPITDRVKLGKLFKILESSPSYKHIICDIFFEFSTDNDSLLRQSITNLSRITIPYQLSSSGDIVAPIFDSVSRGLATIETLNDTFLKYSLTYQDSLHSIPLVVYESLYNTKYEPGWLFGKLGSYRIVDYFIPEYRIRNYDLLIDKSYTLVSLGDLLILGDKNILELANNRLIVIGDFTEYDIVDTPTGEIAGPLLITNVLISLEKGDVYLTMNFMLFIFVSYFLLSLLVFHPNDIVEKGINRLKIGRRLKNFLIGISYVFFLGIISSSSYVIFHLYVNVFFLAIYMFLFDVVRKKKLKV